MSIYIETYGCSANQNNSEIMAGILSNANKKLADSDKDATIIILNTCIVKGPTESKEIARIKQLAKLGKKIVVAGCMSEIAEKKIKAISDEIAIIGVRKITSILDVVESLEKGISKTIINQKKEIKLSLPKISKNPIISIIQISEGCLGNCSYCSVRFAKGELLSYPIDAIVEEVKESVKQGKKEIWLTSQDCSAYGLDINTNLAQLLNEVVKIKGDFKIRVGMSNPNHILPILNDLIKVYKSEKIFKFLHIPIQAGSDSVLKKMNRKYNVAEFKKIVNRFRKEIPQISIATDIICGFAQESDADFQKTIGLVKEIDFEVINISKFWLRKGTPAEKLLQVKSEKIKERSKKLTLLFNRLCEEKNKKEIGKIKEVIIDEKNARSFIGRDDSYKPVVLKGNFKLGDKKKIMIKSAGTHYLIA